MGDRARAKLPAGWRLIPLGELLEFKNGVNAGREAYGKGVRFANVLEVISHSHLTSDAIPGRVSLPRATLEDYEVRRGDVLFNRTSETRDEVGLASVYVDDEFVVFGGFVIRGRLKADVPVIPEYMGYGLRSRPVRQQITDRGQGAIRANIGQRDLRRVLLPLPPRHEQRAIVDALGEADALIRSLSELISKKEHLKLAAAQELLTEKTRLPGFTNPWRRVSLEELGSFAKGRGIRRKDVCEEGVPCIRYGELYTHYDNYIVRPISRVNQQVAQTALPISSGDLLFAGSGETAEEIGKCAAYIGDQPAVAGGDIVVLRSPDHDPVFLGHLLNSEPVAKQKAQFGQGNAVVHIHARHLSKIETRLPQLAEQQAIAKVLMDMDAEIAELEDEREKVSAIKKGMMQELLTGRTRLDSPTHEPATST